jgi:hypothetical protein
MGKRPTNPPKDPLKRLPSWHEDMLNEHYKGLYGLYVRQLLDKASAAERSESAKNSVNERHKKTNEVKSHARDFYLANRDGYKSNKEAAGDLYNRFKSAEFRTYVNWVSRWSSE